MIFSCLHVCVRPCAMVIPDFELICEIMLVAEGFIDARLLARKFISLYTLCKELLSKQVLIYSAEMGVFQRFSISTGNGLACKCDLLLLQDHYDWGLRAIKSVLVVAGTLKRQDKSCPEEQVFMGTSVHTALYKRAL